MEITNLNDIHAVASKYLHKVISVTDQTSTHLTHGVLRDVQFLHSPKAVETHLVASLILESLDHRTRFKFDIHSHQFGGREKLYINSHNTDADPTIALTHSNYPVIVPSMQVFHDRTSLINAESSRKTSKAPVKIEDIKELFAHTGKAIRVAATNGDFILTGKFEIHSYYAQTGEVTIRLQGFKSTLTLSNDKTYVITVKED